ncbi:MAG TPA: hypothetical protein VLG13_00135 [Patescibacteria group bacterium]|nr:hypothetical protein [Patescibacteria group bacterium]
MHQNRSNDLPVSIKSQLSFRAYVPTGDFTIVPSTTKYDSRQALLSLQINKLGKLFTVLTEQPYPDTLIYDKLIGTMLAERQVGNSLGEATVTHPKSAPGKEVVVVQADKTLLFASSDVRLKDADWRALLNSLQPVD